jgi:hypothetical protein
VRLQRERNAVAELLQPTFEIFMLDPSLSFMSSSNWPLSMPISNMGSTGGHVPSRMVAPASAQALAIAHP